MRKDAFKRISGILARYRRHRAWRRVVRALACVVVFCTTYALILPAITLEKKPACGLEEHTHTEDCYAQITELEKHVPVCTLKSLNLHRHTDDCQNVSCGYADFVAHKHDDRCYEENGQLWCPIPEKEAHTHDESCYTLPEAHAHGEDCYQKEKGELTCTVPEGETAHTHSKEAGCYEETKEPTCGLEETEGHQHGEGCYAPGEKLICALSDQPHQHTDTCYAWNDVLTCTASTEPGEPVLTCGKEEIRLHEHTEDCYETDKEGNTYLVCDKSQILEHVHTDACFETVEEPMDTESLTCKTEEGQGAHTHGESCYDENENLICQTAESQGHKHAKTCYGTWTLTCGKEEHTHTEACMVDVETEEDWKKTLPEELSGDWREDLLAVAESQLDYTEAQPDLQLGEEPRRVTRYGAWYGQPEGEWNSLFAMFCLHYAEIPEESLPQDSDISAWVEKLAGRTEGFEKFQLYHSEEDYTPAPGDLVFFGLDEDEAADRVGIVTKYTAARSEEPAQLETIEGDVSGQVAERKYPMDGVRILGYAQLPEQPIVEPVEPVLICGKEEHTHTELCTSPNPEGTGLVIICGREEHTHTEDCCAPLLREYRYEDETVSVTVVLPKDSQVPRDASLRVTPITQSEDRYSILEQQAHAAASGEVRQLVLYDLSFYTQAGEYLPVEESADVTITFKQAVLSGEQVEVLHYGEDSDPVALEDVEVQRGENEALSGLRFKTDGFSVFGVMTTREAGDNVRAASTSVTLYPGQVYTVEEVYTKPVTQNPENVVDIRIDQYPNILKTGSGEDDYKYSGARQPVENAEYTFTVKENGKYAAYHSSTDGSGTEKKIYFDMSTGNDARPSSETEWEFSILDENSTLSGEGVVLPDGTYHIPNGRFALSSEDPKHCLFFHSNENDYGQRLGFRVESTVYYSHWGCNLVLFKKAEEGKTGSAEIPGFVQVTSKTQLESGKQYLIAGKASDEIDGDYYVLYPNLNAANRYEHAAKVSPYQMTLTGKTNGTTKVTAGKQTWDVTVTDQLSVHEGDTISIQLPADAVFASADETIATVAWDGEHKNVIVTGVKQGETNVTVTEGEQTYTWHVAVTQPTFFKLAYEGPEKKKSVITFHLKDANTGEDLTVDTVTNYVGTSATKYLLVAEGAQPAETANQKNIIAPKIDGYQYVGATYFRSWKDFLDWKQISYFATTNYEDDEISVAYEYTFIFYNSPSEWYDLHDDVPTVDVNLNYRKTPITTTISPSGTTINLFDYWVTGENEGQGNGNREDGINKGHALHFTTHDDPLALNQWTNNVGVRDGIVADRLGRDGYPKLSGAHQGEDDPDKQNKESLAYLFDPNYAGPSNEFRRAHHNVNGLLQVDDQGYYYYDSTQNYAEYDGDNNRFNLYPDWSVTHRTVNGQFFPFDPYSTVDQRTGVPEPRDPGTLNHFFGMTLSTRFMQQHGGHTDQQEKVPMSFEFSGDDDVWIFIDGVLVADLGGIHDAASVKIDFAAGTVVINENTDYASTTNFSTIFEGTNVKLTENKVTFTDNSYHTLKFYYMERGGVASNLHLKFNLVTFPASGITKVDQVGDPITGAKFALYRTGADYVVAEGAEPICSGSTDEEGEFVFTGGDGQPLVLEDLYLGRDKNQTDTTDTYPYYVLKETDVPQGYRGTGTDIHLLITEGAGSGRENISSYVMTCTNTRDSGAYASPSLQVTASNELTLMDSQGTKVFPGVSQGTLFGIVLKYIGPEGADKDLSKDANWSPVYGSAAKGYTVVDRAQYPNIKDAIQVAKDHYIGNQNYFHQISNGSFQALIKDLPGNIATYNFMAGNNNTEKVKYIVSYYWTSDKTGTTTRVQDYTTNGGTYAFSRTFGTDIQVPNMKNRIAVQKLDNVTDQPVNGAKFAMYRVDDGKDAPAHNSEAYFYVPDRSADAEKKIHIFLGPDTGGTFQGTARLCSDTQDTGTYEVDRETGKITVTITSSTEGNNDTYYLTPVQVVTTADQNSNSYKENGIAEFEGIVTGKYIIRELTAPTGYSVNPNRAMVLVTDNAIYANAGTEDDGIAVSRGPGYLAGNLHYYASIGEIESTLTWVYDQMKVSEVSDKFSDITPANYNTWKWVRAKRSEANDPGAAEPTEIRKDALTSYLKFIGSEGGGTGETSARFSYAVDPNRPHTVSDNVAQLRRLYTKTGWSYLEILQDYDYGIKAKGVHADYEDWRYVPGTTTPDDLSNLFSRSIYVHVTDPRLPGTLEISKKVVSKDASQTVPNEELNKTFQFTVSLTNPVQNVNKTYKYTVYDNSDPTANPRPVATGTDGAKLENLDLKVENGTAAISLKHDQAAVILDIPGGTVYEIKETTPPKFTTTAVEKVVLENDVPGQRQHNGAVVSGPMYWHAEGDTLDSASKVDFTNTYDASIDTVTITVRKVNAQDPSARLADAEFTLTRVTTDGKIQYNTGSAWTDSKATQTTSTISGEILFPLIEKNGTYTLTEVKAPEGYYQLTEPIKIEMENGVIKRAAMGETNLTPAGEGENKLTLTVPNECGFELPHSGGMGTTAFYTVGALLLLTALLLLIPKRKPANQ